MGAIEMDQSGLERQRKILRNVSVFYFAFGCLFWVWAIINSVRASGFDSGNIVFLFAMANGVHGFTTSRMENPSKRRLDVLVVLTVLSHVFPTIAYTGGAILYKQLDQPVGWLIYVAAFALSWAISGYFAYKFVARYRSAFLEQSNSGNV